MNEVNKMDYVKCHYEALIYRRVADDFQQNWVNDIGTGNYI